MDGLGNMEAETTNLRREKAEGADYWTEPEADGGRENYFEVGVRKIDSNHPLQASKGSRRTVSQNKATERGKFDAGQVSSKKK